MAKILSAKVIKSTVSSYIDMFVETSDGTSGSRNTKIIDGFSHFKQTLDIFRRHKAVHQYLWRTVFLY